MIKRLVTLTLSLLLFPLLLPTPTAAQTVVTRARVGGYAEDITQVTSGALKDQVVMINGYELYSVNPAKKGPLTRICKFDHPEFDQFPNGFAFVPTENMFVLNNDGKNKLFFFDQSCTSKGVRPIQYLNSSYRAGHIEGMAYIPASSPVFPDHLILVAWDDPIVGPARLIVMRRDGVQVAEIIRPDWPAAFLPSEGGLGDVTFLAPNRLLASAYHPDSLWVMDFNGNILSGPLQTNATGTGEGVIQLSDDRLVASDYPQSLLLFDKNLNRQPQNDRHDIIGLNLNVPLGIAWDSDTNQLMVLHDTSLTSGIRGVARVATTLDSATPAIDLNAFPFIRQGVYLPGEDLFATLRFAPGNDRAILLFNPDGSLNSQLSLSPASLGQNLGPPGSLAYLPDSDEFVVGFNGTPTTAGLERQKLRVISRAGALVRTIDLGATGTGSVSGIEYFEDPQGGGGRLMILSAFGRVFITDLDGNSRNANGFVLGEFNVRVKLGLMTRNDIAAITSGPLAGAFAITDSPGGEIVIFRLD
jgi:hypothetical protein